MTNPDINTLNGSLEQLGITMADNLVTMGVSDADPSDGLTTLAGKILSIGPTPPTPTPASITLTADKSILSYADTESAVLTATVLDSSSNPVEGVSVDLYKGSVLWDTLTTGSAGTVSKTYSSAGVGDVGFTAECGSLVTESFVVRDAPLYRQSVSAMELDVSQANIPTNFKATFKFIENTRQGSSCYMDIGADAQNMLRFGKPGSWELMAIYVYNSGSLVQDVSQYDAYSSNTWVNAEFTYNNGVCTLTTGNTTKTLTNSSVTLRDYLKVTISGCSMSDLLIMPL